MTTQIIWLQDIRFIDVALVGGKGATLGELMWKGFPVPPGFVVTVDAYKTFFREAGILDELVDLDQLPQDELDDRCTLIWNKIQQTEIAPDLAEDLLAAYTQLADQGDSPFASVVRSSATAEDLKDASFAGQHETYYYVDQERLLRMIKHCWASLWSPRAVTYRSARRIDHTSFFMAVIVQEMIPAEISGIAFTINPVTGAQDEVIIESSWGMGAAIVDGRVIPDRYIIHRDGLTLREKRIAHKRFMVPPRLQEAGKGRLEKIPHTLRRKQSLAADQIARVARWALQAEEHFGAPQDVEWAIADGRLYVLQSRPIIATEQGELPSDLDGQYILYHPVTAHMSDPLTPLTADLLTLILPPGFHLIRGWIYYDLRSSRLLLPFKMTDHELARLLAFQAAPSFSTIKLSLLKLPISLVLWFSTYLAFGTISARIRNMPDTFMDGFSPFCHKVEKDPAFSPITAIQRLLLQPKLFDPIGRMPLLVHLAALRYVLWLELLKRLLRRWDPDLRHDAAALLIADSHSLISHALNEEISHLTHIADEKARVRKLLLEADLDQILPELRGEPDAQEFLEQLLDFLIRYGHLAVKELELQSIRWEENPVPVLGMIRNSLLSDPTPSPLKHRDLSQGRQHLEAEIRQALEARFLEPSLKIRWRILQFIVKRTKYLAKVHENSRFYALKALYSVRQKVLRIETELLRQGDLRCKDDIFYLRWKEVSRLQTGQLGWSDVEDRIRKRRIEHVRLAKRTPPETIGISIPAEQPTDNCDGQSDQTILQGQSASPGSYEGIAHVVLDPSIETPLNPGEILVAPYTDPAWTPLFLTAGAAIIEGGSYLSHAGTVAREYGIPCVVHVGECTQRIHSGDRLKIDGGHGVVKIFAAQTYQEANQ